MTKINPVVQNLYLPLCSKVHVQESLLAKNQFPKILNRHNLSALNNYAQHEEVSIFIKDLDNDLFHNVGVYLHKSTETTTKQAQFPMVLNEAGKNFAETMKTLYLNVENAVKSFNK